ncbi:hypothetical protein Ddye_013279 [Dipteronia dyeriana]|uniref:Uncharacterized protein n=1 Tax=Dipteronia dyeriana TaxID=168575 RepID=A0AAD9X693_9ROSI|nr:hypothetical protein Ddye_013279 [Dipteronia dyeriana]
MIGCFDSDGDGKDHQSLIVCNQMLKQMIYSSVTCSWKIFGRPFSTHYGVDSRRGVFWNGAVHWANYYFSPSLYFKVDDEKLRKMPMPATPIPDDWDDGRRLRYFLMSLESTCILLRYMNNKF